MSTQITQITSPESNNTNNPDIVFLQSNGVNVIPVTTAEAVVWNDGTADAPLLMSLRKKINNMQNNSNQGGPTYTQGDGITISNTNKISVDPTYIQLYAGKLSFAVVNSVDEVSAEGIIYLIKLNNEYKEYIFVNNAAELLGSVEIDLNVLQSVVDDAVTEKTENLLGTVDGHTLSIDKLITTVGNYTDTENTATGICKEIEVLKSTSVKAIPTNYEISYELTLKKFTGIYNPQLS